MSVKVLLALALRPHVEDKSSLEIEGDTVDDVLKNMTKQYPKLGTRLYNKEGVVNRFINIYVNDEDIRFMDNTDTEVVPGDEISIMPAIVGG